MKYKYNDFWSTTEDLSWFQLSKEIYIYLFIYLFIYLRHLVRNTYYQSYIIETIYPVPYKIGDDELHENTALHQIFHHLVKYPKEDLVMTHLKNAFKFVSLLETL